MGDQNKDLMKRRILVLRELFYRQTDEEHTLSTHEILDYLEELKGVFSEVVQQYEDEDATEETVDLLTGALDAIEDAHDVILDVIEDNEEL